MNKVNDKDRREIAEIKSALEYIKDKVPEKQYKEMEAESNRKIKDIENMDNAAANNVIFKIKH